MMGSPLPGNHKVDSFVDLGKSRVREKRFSSDDIFTLIHSLTKIHP